MYFQYTFMYNICVRNILLATKGKSIAWGFLHGALMKSTMSFVLVFAFCASSSPRKPFVAALISGLNMLILYPLSRGFINLPFYLCASIVEGNFRHQKGYFWVSIVVGSVGEWTRHLFLLLLGPRMLIRPLMARSTTHRGIYSSSYDSILDFDTMESIIYLLLLKSMS